MKLNIGKFEESKESKKSKLKEVSVSFNNRDSAIESIEEIVNYLLEIMGDKNPRVYDAIAFGIKNGVSAYEFANSDEDISPTIAIKKVAYGIIKSLKNRV